MVEMGLWSSLVCAVAFGTVAAPAPAWAAVTFGSADLYVEAMSELRVSDGKGGMRTPHGRASDEMMAWLPTEMAVHAATLTETLGNSAGIDSFGQLAFSAAARGSFGFDFASSIALASNDNYGGTDGYGYGRYSFTIDRASDIAIDFTSAGAIGSRGNARLSYYLFNVAAPEDHIVSGLGSGATTQRLTSGSYQLIVQTVAAGSGAASLHSARTAYDTALAGAQKHAFDGTLNFAITSPVPEPASWAMMIGGFGCVGGAMRNVRRRPVRVG